MPIAQRLHSLYTKSRNPNKNLSPRRNSTQTQTRRSTTTHQRLLNRSCLQRPDRSSSLVPRARQVWKTCLPQRGLNEKCTIHPLVDCCCLLLPSFASSLSRTLSLSSHKSALLFLCAHVTLVSPLRFDFAWLALRCDEASVKRRKVPIKFRRMEESSHTNTGFARRLLLSWGGLRYGVFVCMFL